MSSTSFWTQEGLWYSGYCQDRNTVVGFGPPAFKASFNYRIKRMSQVGKITGESILQEEGSATPVHGEHRMIEHKLPDAHAATL